MVTSAEVFGVTRKLPLNYVERDSADGLLVDNLTREKHLVIFGSSKQGKTSLRKHALKDDDYIVIQCSNKWECSDINSAILKQAGFEVTLSQEKSFTGKSKIKAGLKAGFIFGSANAEAEAEREKCQALQTAPLELDPDDVNDIIRALDEINFNKFIVLEDFHYLPTETQKDFSVALKAYHEKSALCFIIVGVWLEEDRITLYNGDLRSRIQTINADNWTKDELRRVVSEGERLLNIKFNDEFLDELIDNCYGNVHIVQEACYLCLKDNKIINTQDRSIEAGSKGEAIKYIKNVANADRGRFTQFIMSFKDGFQATDLEMHKWILYPVLTSNTLDLAAGLRLRDINATIKSKHPRGQGLNAGNLTQALQSTAELQIQKGTKPFILDYDRTNLRLRVVDTGFMIWLDLQDRAELLALADLPTD